ncbi:hypothetical protein Tco_0058752 [Tanacetum coccineum]
MPRREVELENPLLDGSERLEVLALSHTDFSDLFSVLLDSVNFPHMAKILPIGIHLRQVLGLLGLDEARLPLDPNSFYFLAFALCFFRFSRVETLALWNLGIPTVFFYFLDVIREATTLRLRWNPISIRIVPRMWSFSLSNVVYSVIGFILTLVLTGLLRTTLSTLEFLEGLVLKILAAITLTSCITFDSHVEGAEFEVTGLDKAFVLSTLGRTEDFGEEVTE